MPNETIELATILVTDLVGSTRIRDFVGVYTRAWNEERGSAPGSLPAYAEHQAEQWPRSIEV